MNLKERMSDLIDSVTDKEDREQFEWLLANAWTNMRVADDPEVHQAYVTIICELVPVPRIEEAKAILAKAWEDTEEQRERSLKP
ncbi:MAG: hypothetical protein Tp1111DCM1126091_50 [Prokaryotic dsDNA virus sp.]|nr:MAG: hypothetical protein Tp1111DCM1126091_50 [Prokaryotic dsDNA virus sp.]|tara:strand:+ start:80455 stop:80706 length:252 start_codon:yes stop_codon:yes gene_type:complete